VASSSSLNFNTSLLSCALCYDLPDRKEVEGVKGLPVDYLMHPSNDGKTCSVQLRIRVLSTQHHGYHFILRFRLAEKGVAIEANSQPIRTTSKLDPIRRKIAEQTGQVVVTSEPKTKTKRARSDQLLESLEEIKETQREQSRLISSLFFNLSAMSQPQMVNSSLKSQISLESALERLLVAYNSIDVHERPLKLRHIVSSIPAKEYQEMLHEVGSVLSNPLVPASPLESTHSLESVSPSFSEYPSSSDTSSPSPDEQCEQFQYPFSAESNQFTEPTVCTHLKELELWNSALHDILTQEDE